MKRVVKDELLDEMDPSDLAAVRSRRDLRMINGLMGGERWICRELVKLEGIKHCIEIGAGEGKLAERIKSAIPEMKVSALDRVPQPEGLARGVEWLQEDVFDLSVEVDRGVAIVANLFVHHFKDDVLWQLFEKFKGAGAILLAEPYRSRGSMLLGRTIFPLVNWVTKHDMIVSIEAGFVGGELSGMLADWHCEETKSLLGGIRLKGEQR